MCSFAAFVFHAARRPKAHETEGAQAETPGSEEWPSGGRHPHSCGQRSGVRPAGQAGRPQQGRGLWACGPGAAASAQRRETAGSGFRAEVALGPGGKRVGEAEGSPEQPTPPGRVAGGAPGSAVERAHFLLCFLRNVGRGRPLMIPVHASFLFLVCFLNHRTLPATTEESLAPSVPKQGPKLQPSWRRPS